MGKMMNNTVLGSAFELSLRYLLLLNNIDAEHISEERICLLDYITTYAQDFGMSSFNLHGNGEYRQGEYWSRHSLTHDALKDLVGKGLADVAIKDDSFVYNITDIGTELCSNMNSKYAYEYSALLSYVDSELAEKTDSHIKDTVLMVIRNVNIGGNK